MTKREFVNAIKAVYRAANHADSDVPLRWTTPDIAVRALCARHLDAMLHDLKTAGVFTAEEHQAIYDTL